VISLINVGCGRIPEPKAVAGAIQMGASFEIFVICEATLMKLSK
jgi:hypothetical protein